MAINNTLYKILYGQIKRGYRKISTIIDDEYKEKVLEDLKKEGIKPEM